MNPGVNSNNFRKLFNEVSEECLGLHLNAFSNFGFTLIFKVYLFPGSNKMRFAESACQYLQMADTFIVTIEQDGNLNQVCAFWSSPENQRVLRQSDRPTIKPQFPATDKASVSSSSTLNWVMGFGAQTIWGYFARNWMVNGQKPSYASVLSDNTHIAKCSDKYTSMCLHWNVCICRSCYLSDKPREFYWNPSLDNWLGFQ